VTFVGLLLVTLANDSRCSQVLSSLTDNWHLLIALGICLCVLCNGWSGVGQRCASIDISLYTCNCVVLLTDSAFLPIKLHHCRGNVVTDAGYITSCLNFVTSATTWIWASERWHKGCGITHLLHQESVDGSWKDELCWVTLPGYHQCLELQWK